MQVEKKVCRLLLDLGYSTDQSIDLQRVFQELYRKGMIEGGDYLQLHERFRKYSFLRDDQMGIG